MTTGFYAGLAGIAGLILVLWLLGLIGQTHRAAARAKLHSQTVLVKPPVASAVATPAVWGAPVPVVPNQIVNLRYPQMNR